MENRPANKWRRLGHIALAIVVAALFIAVPVALHEGVHAAVAIVLGVSPSALDVGFVGVTPGVELAEPLGGWRLDLFLYSGGLISGAATLLVYWRWWWSWSGDKTEFADWWLGALILVVAGNELGNGIAEGMFNTEYLDNQPPATLISLAGPVIGYLVHRYMLGSRGARLAVLRGVRGSRAELEAAARCDKINPPKRARDFLDRHLP